MKVTRKIYLSIFTTMFILLTCVATTFAWVGMFTSSTLGSFDLNLKVQDPKDVEYYLQISSTGEENSFDEAVNLADVQAQIMDNMNIVYYKENETYGYSDFNSYSDYINTRFSRMTSLLPVTPGYDSSLDYKIDLNNFYEFDKLKAQTRQLIPTKKYFKFNLYLTVDTPSGIQTTTDIDANVFFDNIEKALSGRTCGGELTTANPFSTIPTTDPNYPVLSTINGFVRTNSINAARVAFEVYDPIEISNSYTGTEVPTKTIIYQGGTQLPSYDSTSGAYSFGGILPEEYNLAIKELNTMYRANVDIDNVDQHGNYLYESALYRYNNGIDKEMTISNRVIWNSRDSTTKYLGVKNGVQTKMKMTVYFWFEGWDADCLSFINKVNVGLDLTFSTDRKE